jgi:2-keto-4-pentenoate hydratase/2-oxohepta-3-ene-1,7-dioic acid hydratase in catechol pathway
LARVHLLDDGERLRVGKILAVGRNYAKHIDEMNAPRTGHPVIFLKPSTALVGDGGKVPLPREAGQVHHEVELVVVVGERGKTIPAERALDHVLGYAVGLDMTLRDIQTEAKRLGNPWCVSKGFDGSAPVSAVARRETVGDGSGLEIELDVNGEPRQLGNTSQMLYNVAELIAHVSRWFTLERGDLLFTGTPAGVGLVAPGDLLQARLERVGSLTVTVVEEGAD